MLKDKEMMRVLWVVALPIALQNLLMSLLNMVDTIMIGALGDLPVASVGLANQTFFILSLFVFGVTSGTSIYVSQYFGKQDFETLKKPVAYSLEISAALSLFFAAVSLFLPKYCLMLFTNDPEVIALGSDYLKIAGWSYLFYGLSFPFAVSLRSTEQARTPLVVTALALLMNTCLNYLLIFGHYGFPKLGVQGAAIATSVARLFELCVFVWLVYGRKNIVAPRIKDFVIEKHFFQKFMKTIGPVILNESMWGMGVSMYSAVFGRMSKEVVAANQIARNAEQLLTALGFGVGSAAAVMIGKTIGQRDREGTLAYARKFTVIAIVLGLCLGILMIVLAPAILGFYTVSDLVKGYAIEFLCVFGAFMVVKLYNYTNVVGILRGGGDTMFCFLLDTGAVWLIGVPLTFLAGLVWQISPVWVMVCVCVEEVVKTGIGFFRVRSKKWINDLVN